MINLIRMLTIDEGIQEKVYTDTRGFKTSGIGFNMDDPFARGVWVHADIPESFNNVYNGTQNLSRDSAWKLLNVGINNAKSDLQSIFGDITVLPEHIQLSIINLMFNMGKHVFLQFKTFIYLIKGAKYDAAAEDLSHTLWAREVPNRAKRIVLLLTGDDSGYN